MSDAGVATRTKVQAVLFDLDGTLVDSFDAIAASVNHVRERRGLSPLPEPEVRQAVGHGMYRLLERTVPYGDLNENAAWFLEHHPHIVGEGTRLLEGVGSTLHHLANHGIRIAICSNKPLTLTRRVLEVTGLTPLVAAALGPESVPHRKPAPDMILEALRLLEVPASAAVYVGDMDVDLLAGQAAGVPVWLIPTGPMTVTQLHELGSGRVIQRFDELCELAGN